MRPPSSPATGPRHRSALGRAWVLCQATLALTLCLSALASGATVTLGAAPTPSAAVTLGAEPAPDAVPSTPSLTLLEGGDPRSEGQGPGLVGSPLAILLGVIVLGIATAALTAVIALLTRRDR